MSASTESVDIGRIEDCSARSSKAPTRVVTVDAIAPSVFAHRILLAWDYSFLDDGERANRRSRTVSLNRAMAEDVLRTEDLSAMLAADAVESVEAEVSGRAMARRARDRDELYKLIRAHGALASGALKERVAGEAHTMLDALEREGRVTRAHLSPGAPEMLIASEDAAIFAAAYPEAVFERAAAPPPPIAVSGAQAPEVDDAEREIVRRAMATSGPVEIADLAERVKMAPTTLEKHLLALEAKGLIFRGHFTPRRPALGAPRERATRGGGVAASPEQWCDRYNLEKIHRLTLNRLRSETEPAADHEYAAFRMRWSHMGGAGIAGRPVRRRRRAGAAFRRRAKPGVVGARDPAGANSRLPPRMARPPLSRRRSGVGGGSGASGHRRRSAGAHHVPAAPTRRRRARGRGEFRGCGGRRGSGIY